jgi:hypothetical protein
MEIDVHVQFIRKISITIGVHIRIAPDNVTLLH